jgi:hypothetical protein
MMAVNGGSIMEAPKRPQSKQVTLSMEDLAGIGGGRPDFGQETVTTDHSMYHHQWTPDTDQYSYVEAGKQDNSDADSPVNEGPKQYTKTEITRNIPQ